MNIVNKCADIFVEDVAKYRKLNAEDVPKQYGDGGVYPISGRFGNGSY
jgi:hypothetical protein